jgi:hypothetical protein
MAGNVPTSVRGNMTPPSGATSTMPSNAQGTTPLLPDTLTIRRLSEVFMDASDYNDTVQNVVTLTNANQTSFAITNIGLGESMDLLVQGSISLANSQASPTVMTFSPIFPFDLISNILVQFNGQTVICSLSGYELLQIMSKRVKGLFLGEAPSIGTVNSQIYSRIDRAYATVTAGANSTFTAGNTITGETSVSIASSSTGIINFTMWLKLPFVMSDQGLLFGMLPMQNNSVQALVTLTTPQIIGTTFPSPIYGSLTYITLAATNITCTPIWNFWAIPAVGSSQLYSYLCSHNYMLLSQTNNILAKTGAEALQYQFPNNYYLMSCFITLRDSTGALSDILSTTAGLTNIMLNYNGTARVDRRPQLDRLARDTMFYEAVPCGLGVSFLDFTAGIAYESNTMNTAKWLDFYEANAPLLEADVQASYSTTGYYSVLREQLVPSQVQLV